MRHLFASNGIRAVIVTAESVAAVFEQREQARGLQMVHESKYLRFFQAKFQRLQGRESS